MQVPPHNADRAPRGPAGQPLRVAAVIATRDVSGPGRQLVALFRELQRRGTEVLIVNLVRSDAPHVFKAFASAQGIECLEMTDRGPIDPQLVKQMRAFIDRWQPDVVQTHSYKPSSIMYALGKLGTSCAWVGFHEGETDKGVKDWLYTRIDFRMLRAAHAVVVMSQVQKAMFPARLSQVNVVLNAVPELPRAADTTALPALLRRRRGEGPVPMIGAIGRLSREKGVDVLIDAVAVLKSRGRPVRTILVGDGALEADLVAQAKSLGLQENVFFTGRIDAMREVYEALDLMVIPSRSEGLPSVLLEALPTGLPVVSTRVGAMPDMVREEPHSLRLVAPEQPLELADAIAAELDNLASPEAAVARARLAAAYSVERRCDHMLRIYSSAIRARGAT